MYLDRTGGDGLFLVGSSYPVEDIELSLTVPKTSSSP